MSEENIQTTSAKPVLCDGFLIPMTDFVLKYYSDETMDELQILDLINNYANFLKQPLKLEMFVPCDDEGIVLEEPKIEEEYVDEHTTQIFAQYQYDLDKAKEKVLFELNIDSDYKFDISDYKFICNYYVNLENWLKDNDVLYKIKLSQTALDSIFGETVAKPLLCAVFLHKSIIKWK